MATLSFVPGQSIQQVKDLIGSHHFVRALKIINTLQSEYPPSTLVLALKALLYERTGRCETLAICSESKEVFFTDKPVLPDVLDILQTVFQRLGEYNLATSYYEYACAEVTDSLALMTGHFYCYVRGLSFNDQLKISLKMYKFDQERRRKFLFWSVLSIQSQVFYQLLTTHVKLHKLEELETLLVSISVTEHQAKNDFAHEILSKLGLTLLVAEVSGQRVKRVRLLARVCDYTAAMEVLSQKLESSFDDWECQLLGDASMLNQITPSIFHACKLSEYKAGSPWNLKKTDFEMGKKRCLHKSNSEVDEAVQEYFDRLGSYAKVSFEVLTKVDELQFIKDLLKQPPLTLPALQEMLSYKSIDPGLKSVYHGTSIALKTKNFILLLTDGKFTEKTSYNALKLKADKVKDFGDMGVALSGDWANSAKMISSLATCVRFLKDENRSRPTVSKFAKFTRQKPFFHIKDTEILFGGFDLLKGSKTAVPCISYASDLQSFDIEELFFCAGTGRSYANAILSQGNVHVDMKFGDAINLAEKALVYADMRDGCTGGWANILVIEKSKPIKRMAREHISTTLWNRHHSALESMNGLMCS